MILLDGVSNVDIICCLDDVEKVIGMLLRDAGDKLNEEVRVLSKINFL